LVIPDRREAASPESITPALAAFAPSEYDIFRDYGFRAPR
jgi:hypothetical protein